MSLYFKKKKNINVIILVYISVGTDIWAIIWTDNLKNIINNIINKNTLSQLLEHFFGNHEPMGII